MKFKTITIAIVLITMILISCNVNAVTIKTDNPNHRDRTAGVIVSLPWRFEILGAIPFYSLLKWDTTVGYSTIGGRVLVDGKEIEKGTAMIFFGHADMNLQEAGGTITDIYINGNALFVI